MARKRILMFSFLISYTLILMLILLNSNEEKIILSTFIYSLLAVIIYTIFFVRFFSTSFLFIVFYLMLFYIQPIYNLLGEYYYYEYNLETIRIMTLLVVIGLMLFCIGNCLLIEKSFRLQKKIHIDKLALNKAVKLIGTITIISIIFCFIDAGTLNIIDLGREQLKGTTGLLRNIATYGLYTTSIMFFLVFFTISNRSRSNVIKWIIIFILVSVVVFLLFRTRSLLVAHSISILVGYYYSDMYSVQVKNSKRQFSPRIISLIIGVVVFLLAIILRFFRGFLQPGQSVKNFDFDLSSFLETSIEGGDIGYATTILKVIGYVPEYHDFLGGQSYYRVLFTFIPRSIWSGKPENTQQIVGDWFRPDVPGYTLPPGVIGDAYINFGISGIIILVLFGLFCAVLDNKLSLKNFMLWAVSGSWVFHIVRGGFTTPLIIFAVLFIVVSFINKSYFFKSYWLKGNRLKQKPKTNSVQLHT